jgi:hypothetical protein
LPVMKELSSATELVAPTWTPRLKLLAPLLATVVRTLEATGKHEQADRALCWSPKEGRHVTGTPWPTSTRTNHQQVCALSAPTSACCDNHSATSPVLDTVTWLRNLGGSSRQGSLRGGAPIPNPGVSSSDRRTTIVPKSTYAMPRAGERITIGVRNEVAATTVCDVLCPTPGAHELTDDFPATGKLERDVDLGVGCHHRHPCYGRRCWCQARLAPSLGMGRGHDAAEIAEI